ncbi:MAG TPA: hypothetical protein VLN49_19905 [Gemmatimonadaceae bacterium]|nr:hypothetical protein [Gemmatimonadaceae bacterium]
MATTRVTYPGRLPGSILVVTREAAPGIARSSSTLADGRFNTRRLASVMTGM